MKSIRTLSCAVTIIEKDGVDGFATASELVGREVALAILITYLRISLGSLDSFPANPEIGDKVLKLLSENNIS